MSDWWAEQEIYGAPLTDEEMRELGIITDEAAEGNEPQGEEESND